MRKLSTIALSLTLLLSLWGCAAKTTTVGGVPPAPTLPANARDAADANAFRVIADAYAFLNSVRNSGITLSATQKTVFNDLVISYNAAYTVGLAYHAGSGDAASLAAATTTLSSNLTSASAQIVVHP